jgi:mRNA-degrading endonuclease toxin of MazEF toxin-antitoxin module
MPQTPRGHVHYYSFGPAHGAELAGNRAALVISNDRTNFQRQNYVALPTSSSEPPLGQGGNHVRIQDACDWASIQKITTINHRSLGGYIGKATPDELQQVVAAIQDRLTASNKPGDIHTSEGLKNIRPGVVFETNIINQNSNSIPATFIVIDYNDGNNIALAVRLYFPPRAPTSPVSVPVQIQSNGERGTAMVNQILPIHLPGYNLYRFQETDPKDVGNIVDQLLTVIDE